MQNSAADAKCIARRKRRADTGFFVGELQAGERKCQAGIQFDAETMKDRDTVREQTLTTGLVDRRLSRIDDQDAKSLETRSDRGCQAGGSTADNKNIGSQR